MNGIRRMQRRHRQTPLCQKFDYTLKSHEELFEIEVTRPTVGGHPWTITLAERAIFASLGSNPIRFLTLAVNRQGQAFPRPCDVQASELVRRAYALLLSRGGVQD